MSVVWKFSFPVEDAFTLSMPRGAHILAVQAQNEQPCLWARVDPEAPPESRSFRLAGTGHPLRDDDSVMKHRGTFQIFGGDLVFHLFEMYPKGEPEAKP